MAARVTGSPLDGARRGWGTIEVVRSDGTSGMLELAGPSGSPKNPLTGPQLEEKFRDCAAHALKPIPGRAADEIINLIRGVGDIKDTSELIKSAAV